MDIGAHGRNGDGGVFSESLMGQNLEKDKFNVPGDKSYYPEKMTRCHTLWLQMRRFP